MICLNDITEGDRGFPRVCPAISTKKGTNAIASLQSALKGSGGDSKRGLSVLRTTWMSVFVLIGIAFNLEARADYWFKINDASQIQYLIGSPNTSHVKCVRWAAS